MKTFYVNPVLFFLIPLHSYFPRHMRKLPPSFPALLPRPSPSLVLHTSENTHAHALGGRRGRGLGARAGFAGEMQKKGWERERREPRYLTDNVIIVSQCTGMRDVRRGVAQFPYIWVGALSDGGQREIIIVLLRCRPVLTAGCRKMEGGEREEGRGGCGVEDERKVEENKYGVRGKERKGGDIKQKEVWKFR